MLVLLDTANIGEVKCALEAYPIDGVTTNPTLIAREKGDFLGILRRIRQYIGVERLLCVQVVGTTAEKMIDEAQYIKTEIDGKLAIKIPATSEGIKAMKHLKEDLIEVMATAVFSPQQALLIAKAGADYIVPYVNRIDNIGSHGVETVKEIVRILQINDLKSQVMAASFKNTEQVQQCCLAGLQGITVSFEILDMLAFHPMTNLSVNQFTKDWEQVYGIGKTTLDS